VHVESNDIGSSIITRFDCVTQEDSNLKANVSVGIGRAGAVRSAYVGGLVPGTAYSFRCTASNEAGVSEESASSVKIMAGGLPSAPIIQDVRVTGDRQLTIFVERPSFTGASPLLGCECMDTADSLRTVSGNWVDISTSPMVVALVVPDLVAGQGYRFSCSASNELGTSPSGDNSSSVVALRPPLAPTVTCIVPKLDAANVQVAAVEPHEFFASEFAAASALICGSPQANWHLQTTHVTETFKNEPETWSFVNVGMTMFVQNGQVESAGVVGGRPLASENAIVHIGTVNRPQLGQLITGVYLKKWYQFGDGNDGPEAEGTAQFILRIGDQIIFDDTDTAGMDPTFYRNPISILSLSDVDPLSTYGPDRLYPTYETFPLAAPIDVGESAAVTVQIILSERSTSFRIQELIVTWSEMGGLAVADGADMWSVVANLPSGNLSQVWCESQSSAGNSRTELSANFTVGVAVTAVYALEGDGVSDLKTDDLRQTFAAELGVHVSQIVAEVGAADGSFSGCISFDVVAFQNIQLSAAGGRRLEVATRLVQVKVMFADDQDPEVTSVMRSLDELGVSNSFAQTLLPGSTISVVEEAAISSPGFRDSSLKSLRLVAADGSALVPEPVLDPPFDPAILLYDVEVTTMQYGVEAVLNSTLAFAPQVGDLYLPIVFDVQVVWPLTRAIPVSVTARDQTRTTYVVRVSYLPVQCGICLNGAGCNQFTGTCQCTSDYFGADCATYCPGIIPCSGRGQCGLTTANVTGGCDCDSTYGGPGCTQRICPACENGGICIAGTQADDSEWTCDCGTEHSGDLCEWTKCPNDCNEAGDCQKATGVCECYPGWSGTDCTTPRTMLEPIGRVVEVALVFGIEGYEGNGKTKYDAAFNFESGIMQQWVIDVCAAAKREESLSVRNDVTAPKCWVEDFEDYLVANRLVGIFPDAGGSGNSSDVTRLHLFNFFSSNLGRIWYKHDFGTEGSHFSGRIKYTQVRMKINVLKGSATSELQIDYKNWQKFVERMNLGAPDGGKFIMVSKDWTNMQLELEILDSTLTAFSISIGISLMSILFFTGNVLIAMWSVFATLMTILTLIGIITCIFQWEFGAVQVVGLTTFVGLSVDYTLHLAHAYNHANASKDLENKRMGKLQSAFIEIGAAILGGAATTAGSTAFLFPTWIYLFHQLGVMLCCNTLIALLYSFLFLAPLLLIAGPVGNCGNLFRPLECLLAKRSTQQDSPSYGDRPPQTSMRGQVLAHGASDVDVTKESNTVVVIGAANPVNTPETEGPRGRLNDSVPRSASGIIQQPAVAETDESNAAAAETEEPVDEADNPKVEWKDWDPAVVDEGSSASECQEV